jgi:hypothetical protein
MKIIPFLALLLTATNGLAEKPAPAPSPSERDYAVMAAEPFKAEIQLGEKRLDKFLRHLNSHRRALLDQTPYVAIQVGEMTASELPYLTRRIYRGSITASQFYQDVHAAGALSVQYLLIFDSRTRKMVNEDGVFITDTPPRNTVALFGSLHAVYAATVFGW